MKYLMLALLGNEIYRGQWMVWSIVNRCMWYSGDYNMNIYDFNLLDLGLSQNGYFWFWAQQ